MRTTSRKPDFGVEREDHPARGAVGADHLHHAHGKADLEMVESVVDAIDDRAVGEERGEALAAGLDNVIVAADVEIALVLAGEARRRQILRGRRTAHRDGDIGAVLSLQLLIGGDDFPPQRFGPGRIVDDLSRLRAALLQKLDVDAVDAVHEPAQLFFGPRPSKRVVIGANGEREAVRHAHSL